MCDRTQNLKDEIYLLRDWTIPPPRKLRAGWDPETRGNDVVFVLRPAGLPALFFPCIMRTCYVICWTWVHLAAPTYSPTPQTIYWGMDALHACNNPTANASLTCLLNMYFFSSFFQSSLLPPSLTRGRFLRSAVFFWTSRGHRCHPFPPGTCLHFYRA